MYSSFVGSRIAPAVWHHKVGEACVEFERQTRRVIDTRQGFKDLRARMPKLTRGLVRGVDDFLHEDMSCIEWSEAEWRDMPELQESELRTGFGRTLPAFTSEEKDMVRRYLSYVLIGRPFGEKTG
jgi:hypothetical protein